MLKGEAEPPIVVPLRDNKDLLEEIEMLSEYVKYTVGINGELPSPDTEVSPVEHSFSEDANKLIEVTLS